MSDDSDDNQVPLDLLTELPWEDGVGSDYSHQARRPIAGSVAQREARRRGVVSPTPSADGHPRERKMFAPMEGFTGSESSTPYPSAAASPICATRDSPTGDATVWSEKDMGHVPTFALDEIDYTAVHATHDEQYKKLQQNIDAAGGLEAYIQQKKSRRDTQNRQRTGTGKRGSLHLDTSVGQVESAAGTGGSRPGSAPSDHRTFMPSPLIRVTRPSPPLDEATADGDAGPVFDDLE